MWTRKQVAQTIDHSALKPFLTDNDIIAACELAKKYQVATVCVRPTDVPLAQKILAGSPVKCCAVIGFPHGSNRPEVKALEAQLAISDGAAELDMVMNIGKFLSGDYDHVQKDIEAVVNVARPHHVCVKVILEICNLSLEQVARASEICRAAGADYVKTSTGFGHGPATPEAVEVMMKTVGHTMRVKAAGGVRTYESAVLYLDLGCKRLGATATETILEQAPPE
ncbi:MAG: deoxyribose-phosphate aldolase [Sedimentisphaerales bacterium]|nr:deoxyribose-phosphate aldolase [Sedimentisphaerales bacterium]